MCLHSTKVFKTSFTCPLFSSKIWRKKSSTFAILRMKTWQLMWIFYRTPKRRIAIFFAAIFLLFLPYNNKPFSQQTFISLFMALNITSLSSLNVCRKLKRRASTSTISNNMTPITSAILFSKIKKTFKLALGLSFTRTPACRNIFRILNIFYTFSF